METILQTDRLTLRPLQPDDATSIQRECNNRAVARMTMRIPHPYPDGLAEDWIRTDRGERVEGSAFRFAVEHESELVGVVGLEMRAAAGCELGYWIGEPWWGKGVASEAVKRVVDFAFQDLGLEELRAGHFADNPASGRVLEKCGFRYSGEASEWSKARDSEVACRRFVLKRDWAGTRAEGP